MDIEAKLGIEVEMFGEENFSTQNINKIFDKLNCQKIELGKGLFIISFVLRI